MAWLLNLHWMLVFKTFILSLGLLLQNPVCDAVSDAPEFKKILFIGGKIDNSTTFPSTPVKEKFCFNIQENRNNEVCCKDFDCNVELTQHSETTYKITLNESSLQEQDIVVLQNTSGNFSCMPSALYEKKGLILQIHNCLKPGGRNIRLTKCDKCHEEKCEDLKKRKYDLEFKNFTKNCEKNCELPGISPDMAITLEDSDMPISATKAVNIMNDLGSMLNRMGNASTAEIKMGNVTGVIAKLPLKNQTSQKFGFTLEKKVKVLEEKDPLTYFSQSVYLPEEACEMAVEKNGTFAGVMVFPDMPQIDQNHSLLDNTMLGIEMGANIHNLAKTIDMHFTNVNTTGLNATCVSWDGRNSSGTNLSWVTDGCLTNIVNDSITCQCSHLTFFAILMSPFGIGNSDSNGNPSNSTDDMTGQISAADLKALTQITKAGCGMSMFFLGVALFMHFLIRKNKASQAVQILMNLFIALFFLNLTFLINESIANLDNMAACVVMAAFMHYSMLATFTWFFMQALHLYFNLQKVPTDIKYYVFKICCTGWIIPSLVVVGLLSASKYDSIPISAYNGTSATMCWIPDAKIHLGVNIGYYIIVFFFTLAIFILTAVQITYFASKDVKAKKNGSTKKRFLSLLSLFVLLGITWGFAFFSYGTLLLPSYYIFTILNSFQGFFLFVYYYFSSRIVVDDKKQLETQSSGTENTNLSSSTG